MRQTPMKDKPPRRASARLLLMCAWALAGVATVCEAAPGDITPSLLGKVRARLNANAGDTWVSGTQMEAYLELDTPSLSVFSPETFPLPSYSSPLVAGSGFPNQTNNIIATWYQKRPLGADELAEVKSGAAGDPASLGWGWMLATSTATSANMTRSLETCLQQEIDFLLTKVPRTTDGAISHRREQVQLWSDFVYMVPPFLAARGVATGNTSLVLEAYKQIKLYRTYLQDPNSKLWRHVLLGTWSDTNLWATGNAWVAAGMVRVMATMINSGNAKAYSSQITDLSNWTNEILQASFARRNPDGLIPNYLNKASFSDSSSSALLAATAFRMSTLGRAQVSSNVPTAKVMRSIVNNKVNTTTGWLTGSVDPLAWSVPTTQSPEGQAFIVLLQAAYLEYLKS